MQLKPVVLDDLCCKPVVAAMIASARSARRQRLEAVGRVYDPKVKGRYEHTLVEALCSVGRALAVRPDRPAEIEEIKRQIDPSVVGMKRTADGGFKRVYAERRIGDRHAAMLAQFADTTRLKRWFEGPSILWALACAPIRRGRKPQAMSLSHGRHSLREWGNTWPRSGAATMRASVMKAMTGTSCCRKETEKERSAFRQTSARHCGRSTCALTRKRFG